jgi:hypothetical protein
MKKYLSCLYLAVVLILFFAEPASESDFLKWLGFELFIVLNLIISGYLVNKHFKTPKHGTQNSRI